MVDPAPDDRELRSRSLTAHFRARAGGARWFRATAIGVTVSGALILLAAGIRLSGGVQAALRGAPLLVWGLIPFGLALSGLRGRGVGVPRSVGVTITSGFGLVIYAQLLWSSHLSSTAGLAFLFVPFWQTLGCGIALLLTMKWRGTRGTADNDLSTRGS